MIDWDRVATLREEVGAEDFDEVVDLFLSEVDEAIDALSDDTPPDRLADHLHFLKGSALSLGFQQFSGLCQAGETALLHDAEKIVDLGAIVSSYQASRAQFVDHLPEHLAG